MHYILIIDDDEQIRRLCRAILEAGGFEVAEAQDGVTGIAMFERRPADLVLCDIFMPDKDGIETIQELARAYFDVKVIAMSGGAPGLPDYLPALKHFGATAVLAKPFSPDQLVDTVRTVLSLQTG